MALKFVFSTMWNKTAGTQGSSDPCLPEFTSNLRRPAVVYRWFPLQQMIKTSQHKRGSLRVCFSTLHLFSSLPTQWLLSEIETEWLQISLSRTKWDFFISNLWQLSASTEAVGKKAGPVPHNTKQDSTIHSSCWHSYSIIFPDTKRKLHGGPAVVLAGEPSLEGQTCWRSSSSCDSWSDWQ